MGNSLLAVRGINHKYIVVGGNIAGFLFLDILIMSQGDDHSRDRTFDSSVIIITHKEIHIILFKAAVIRKIAL